MKISAFMPVTNAVRRGDTFIEAIKTHLYWADELIVVDGGSTDETIERIEAIGDPRIKIVVEPWNQEAWGWDQFARTWNRGLSEASGDWVAAGESDHIFHEDEAERVRQEIAREESKGKAVVKCQKLQSGAWNQWQSKSQMYYFINKAFPQIGYGFDPNKETDLAHPIWKDGGEQDGVPTGSAIMESNQEFAGLIGGTGANLFNYLWTFKTFDMVLAERTKAAKAWNRYAAFAKIHNRRWPEDPEEIRQWVLGQILSVREKANRNFPIDSHPKIMKEKIENEMRPDFIGSPMWKYTPDV